MSNPSCLTTSSVFERLAKPLVIMSARTKAASPIRLVCAVSASLSSKAPILMTRHRKPRFVMMSYEHYRRIRQMIDPRRVYGAGETPDDVVDLLNGELDWLARAKATMNHDLRPGSVIRKSF